MDQHFNFDLGTKDFGREHKIPYGTGNNFVIKQEPPYGFWAISLTRGQMPKALAGKYTEYSEAEKAVKHYMKTKADAKEK